MALASAAPAGLGRSADGIIVMPLSAFTGLILPVSSAPTLERMEARGPTFVIFAFMQ